MRTCFIIEYYPPHVGGGETLFSGLAAGLVRAGHSCEVVTSAGPGMAGSRSEEGVLVHRVRVPARGDRHFFTVLSLKKALEAASRADVVHTMTYNAAPVAWLCGRVLHKPVVLLAHEVLGRTWFSAGFSRPAALGFKAAEDAVLALPFSAYAANSRSTEESLAEHGIDRRKIRLIYPGLDYAEAEAAQKTDRRAARRRLGFSPEDFGVGFFGRPGAVKGVDVLVEAAARARREVKNLKLTLILSREPAGRRKKIGRMAGELPPGFVQILDPVPRAELLPLIRGFDLAVFPSLSEGFGFSCAEACAAGVPVVASRVGSLPEVAGGKHLLVPPGDPEALAKAIVRASCGGLSAAPVRRFPLNACVEGHIQLYQELVAGREGPA
ncbi:MAG: glycosyltransferase family 4 protein [Thermodesulfobacteriota bacterium]